MVDFSKSIQMFCSASRAITSDPKQNTSLPVFAIRPLLQPFVLKGEQTRCRDQVKQIGIVQKAVHRRQHYFRSTRVKSPGKGIVVFPNPSLADLQDRPFQPTAYELCEPILAVVVARGCFDSSQLPAKRVERCRKTLWPDKLC